MLRASSCTLSSLFIALVAGSCGSAITGPVSLGDVGDDDAIVLDLDVSFEESDEGSPDVGPEQTQVCPPGLSGCVEGNLLICNEDGSAFELVKCDSWLVCWEGDCITCVEAADCSDGAVCQDGECVVLPLEILTEELPPALQGLSYVFELEGQGGILPYMWAIHQGELPEGFTLSAGGVLSGMSDDTGPWPLLVKLTDAQGEVVIAPLSLHIEEHGLHITSPSQLPQAQGGDLISYQLEAIGGEQPYFWGVADGSLPTGLILSSAGVMSGVPFDSGTFEFTLKVFDNGAPPLVDSKDFKMAVTIPPLEIVGSPEIDLFVTKVILLPLILVTPSFPLPYNTELKALGGKAPLSWSEDPLPDLVTGFIPNGGIPDGLTLSEDGVLSGSVTDPSLAVTVTVPVLNVDLHGFFFGARVEDAQTIPYADTALYLIPTLPLGL
jgi:hypothetical protein